MQTSVQEGTALASPKAAESGRPPYSANNSVSALQAFRIMGEDFRPFCFGKALTHFGLTFAEDSMPKRVPWPEADLARGVGGMVLAGVPTQLSVRTMMKLCPQLFLLDDHHQKRECAHLDWAPTRPRYCWLNVRPRRPYTSRPQEAVIELPASFHTVVYITLLALKAGRQLFNCPVTLTDYNGHVVAVVRHHEGRLRLEAPVGQGQWSMYERAPCLC